MDTGVVGPEISALDQSDLEGYEMLEISSYITTILQEYRQKGSYGLFAGLAIANRGQRESVPTIIFGFPKVNVLQQVILPPTPYNLPTFVKNDSIVWTSDPEFIPNPTWMMKEVVEMEKITLEKGISIGIEGI